MTPWFRIRIGFAFFCVLGFFSLIILRLTQLQIIPNSELDSIAKKQLIHMGKKIPYRTSILDRNGEELAVSIPAGSVFARPRMIAQKKKVAKELAKYLGESPQKWYEKLKSDRAFVWIQRQVDQDTAKKIDRAQIPGIFVENENRRVYPNGSLGAHVVGFTGIDGIGLSGVELALNDELLHDKPIASVIKDGKGNPSYVDKGYLKGQDVKPGTYLTLDRRVQNIIEEEIEKTRSDFKAKSAMAIVMDPNSGEVFALAQSPAFDPNMPNQSPSENQRNSVISGLFEPGSTMKVLLASELLEQKLADPKTNFDCGNGELVIYDKTIREAEAIHRFKQLSLEKIIRYSSNVGAVRFGQLLGKERFKEMFARFGLNRKTGIDLPGENSSPIKNNYLDIPLHLATASFGQGIAVTPLQMVTAFAPIANGGFYVTPKLLVKDVNPFEPKKRILSDFTAKRMREILTSVVESGTGANAKLTGIQVAGKTGTAQKFEGAKGYSGGKYFSSFIGFLPADKPKLLIGVMVDEPTEKYFAADVAVPLFKRIGERVIYTMDLMPKPQFTKSNSKELPSYRVSKADLVATENGQWVMPDLQGRSLRDLMKSVGGVFDSLIIEGSGYVNKQDPAPGVPVSSQTPIKLTLNP